MANITSTFSLYDFFSVFLPGLAFIVSMLPLGFRTFSQYHIGTAIAIIIAGSFIVGQAIHSLASLTEKNTDIDGHRDIFGDFLKGERDKIKDSVIKSFKRALADDFAGLERGDDADDEFVNNAYLLCRSKVHADGRGRSRHLQAIYAFCRSMCFTSFIVAIIYAFVGPFLGLKLATPIIVISMIFLALFWGATLEYRKHYVEYLITDYLAIR